MNIIFNVIIIFNIIIIFIIIIFNIIIIFIIIIFNIIIIIMGVVGLLGSWTFKATSRMVLLGSWLSVSIRVFV